MTSSSSISTRTVVAIVAVVVLAAALWLLVLSPKRQKADEVAKELDQQQQTLTEAQAQATEALAAKRSFPKDYRKLVILGKSVPESDDTASLLVQLSRISENSKTDFESLALQSTEAGGEEGVPSVASEAGPTSAPEPVPPTEAEASLLPLGATVGTANLAVMPYSLSFNGSFFRIAKFIRGIENQIRTTKKGLVINGRLLTIDGFSLTENGKQGFPVLTAEFAVTAYLTPPSQTAEGAAPELAAPEGTVPSGAPEAATTSGTPSSYSTGEAR